MFSTDLWLLCVVEQASVGYEEWKRIELSVLEQLRFLKKSNGTYCPSISCIPLHYPNTSNSRYRYTQKVLNILNYAIILISQLDEIFILLIMGSSGRCGRLELFPEPLSGLRKGSSYSIMFSVYLLSTTRSYYHSARKCLHEFSVRP